MALLAIAFAHSKSRLGRRILLYLASAFAGALFISFAYAAIYASFGRHWLFFMPQMNYLLWQASLKSGAENPSWVPPSWDWIRASSANAFMFAMFIVSAVEIAVITAQRKTQQYLVELSIYSYSAVYAIAVLLEIRGLNILEPDYMSLPINLAALLPLLATIGRRARTPPSLAVLASPVLFAAALFAYSSIRIPIAQFWPVLLGVGTLYLAIAAPFSGTLAAILMPALNATLIGFPGLYQHDRCHVARHLNTIMFEASKVGVQITARPDTLHVWFDRHEVLTAACFSGLPIEYIGVSFTSIAHAYFALPFGGADLTSFKREDFDKATAEGGGVAVITMGSASAFIERGLLLGHALEVAAMYYDRRTQLRFYFLRPR
jgi:hypothetical protein